MLREALFTTEKLTPGKMEAIKLEANEWWSIGGGLGLLVLALWRWKANAWQRRYRRLRCRIDDWGEKKTADQLEARRLLKKLHKWLLASIEAGDEAGAYRLLELLKQAYGEGVYSLYEFSRLAGIVVRVLQREDMQAIGVIAVEAFTPLIRRAPLEELGQGADQLGLIGVLALRYRQPFLADKVVVELQRVMDRLTSQYAEEGIAALLRAIRVMGTMCLRRKNMDLFQALVRDIQERMIQLTQNEKGIRESWMLVILFWLHRAARQNQLDAARLLCLVMEELWQSEKMIIDAKSKEWLQDAIAAAATACFNPHSQIDQLIIAALTKSVATQSDALLWRSLVREVKRLAVFGAMRHGPARAMQLWLPVLEFARKCLRAQMRTGVQENELRHYVIVYVLQEMEAYIALLARNDMQKTPLDFLKQIHLLWDEDASGPQRRKSIEAFCQLVALRWLENKRRAKRYNEGETWLEELVLTPDLLYSFGIKASYREKSSPAIRS